MEASTATRILNSGANIALEKKGFIPLQMVGENAYSLSHAEDGVCHFYQDDLCELHRSHGISHKPVVCQLYPYTIVNTPEGLFVSHLYSCPAVVAGTGACAEEQMEGLIKLFDLHGEKVPRLTAPDSRIPVTVQDTITWPEYLELEQQFIQLVDGSDPVVSFLRMVELLLPGNKVSTLASRLVEVCQTIKTEMLLENRDRGEFQILRTATMMESECIKRFVLQQIHGKLLLVGHTLVSQLLMYAVSLAVFLDLLESRKKRNEVLHFSFQHLYHCFEFLEEKLISQSRKSEKLFLAWEMKLVGSHSPCNEVHETESR